MSAVQYQGKMTGVAVGQGRRLRSTSLHVLLLTLAIQGVTPDSHDLASLTLFRMPCLVLAGSDLRANPGETRVRGAMVRESAPAGEGHTVTSEAAGEPTPDEVCESASRMTHRVLLKRMGVPRHLGAAGQDLTARLNPAELKHHRGAPVDEARGAALIHFLCRLIC